jgi:membrane-associated progesterone receptor component
VITTLTISPSPLGTIFDVSRKADVYGKGGSYHVFAGKDGSKGLGMSSLKPEHAISDYSGLDESETKVLNDWYAFFRCVFHYVVVWRKRLTEYL